MIFINMVSLIHSFIGWKFLLMTLDIEGVKEPRKEPSESTQQHATQQPGKSKCEEPRESSKHYANSTAMHKNSIEDNSLLSQLS